MSKLDEKELKELFTQLKEDNSQLAVEKMYYKYKKIVFGIAFSILRNQEEAEDVVQNVFLKIYSLNVDKLPSKNEYSWLYSVTKNEALMMLRKKVDNINIDEIYNIKDENEEIANAIDRESYNKLISKLPEDEREIVSLKIIAGFSFDEIGEILGKSPNTIKWKYYKSINTLKLSIGSLIMFIISFVMGCNFTQEEQNEKEENVGKGENEIIENTNEDYIMTENSIENEATAYTEENTFANRTTNTNNNYPKNVFFDFAIIFLIFTIAFIISFVKHQLKLKKIHLKYKRQLSMTKK